MPRIRSIKPEIPSVVAFARLPVVTRYHFLLCKTVADDLGYFRATPRLLAGQLYPHDRHVSEGDVDRMNAELVDGGFLRVFHTADGPVAQVVGWTDPSSPFYERVVNPSKSHLAEILGVAPLADAMPEPTTDLGLGLVEGGASAQSRCEPDDYATKCVRAVNEVLAVRLAGSYRPLVASMEAPTTSQWRRDGVPLEVAVKVLRDRTSTFPNRYGRQPSHLTYFDRAVREAFEQWRLDHRQDDDQLPTAVVA